MLLLRGREFLGPSVPRDLDFDGATQQIQSLGGAPILLLARGGKDAHEAGMLRQLLGPNDIEVLVHTSQSPTRQLLLSLCLAQLDSHCLGMAEAVLGALQSEVNTYAAVKSVGRLSSPAPSLGQHLRSLFPGSMFSVDLGADAVTSVSQPTWPTVTSATIGAWCAGDKAGKLDDGLSQTGLPQIKAPVGATPWGAKAWAEMSTLSQAPDTLVARLISVVESQNCGYCGRITGVQGCRFCGTYFKVAKRPDAVVSAAVSNGKIRKENS